MNDLTPLVLRPVTTPADLEVLFGFHREYEANHMAAFTVSDPNDRAAFDARWRRLLAGPTVMNSDDRLDGSRVAGTPSIRGDSLLRTRIVLTALIALVAVACGDGAGTGVPGDEVPAPTAPTASDQSAPTSPGGDAGTGVPSSQCIELGMALSQAASFGMTGTGDLADSVAALEAMAFAAPPEIAADLLLIAEAFAEFAQALAAAGVDLADPSTFSSPAAQEAMQAASDAFDAAGIEEAGARIDAYLSEVCD